MSVCVKKYMCIYFKVLCRACISAGPLHEPFGVKGAENDRSPNLTVASSQRTLRTRKAVGMCVYIYIYYVAMVTMGLTPLYIHLSKIQHSI